MKTQPLTEWYNTFTPRGPIACALRNYLPALRTATFMDNEHGDSVDTWLNGALTRAVNVRLKKGDHDITITRVKVVTDRHHTLYVSWNHVVNPPEGLPSYVEAGEAQLTLYALSNKAKRAMADEEAEGVERAGPSRGDARKRKLGKTKSY